MMLPGEFYEIPGAFVITAFGLCEGDSNALVELFVGLNH